MKQQLSSKQKLLYQIIKDYQKKYGISPSLNELKKELGVPFVNSVVHLLEKLEEKGYLTRTPSTERGIKLLEESHQTINVPVVGAVACGQPLLAKQNIEGYIPVDKNLLSSNSADYFFLRAVGDSMDNSNVNGNNIENGDFVLIKTQSTANYNDKIVALIDDEATIKVYKKQQDYIALVPQSTNPANKPIILHSDFTIQGIVKAVFKKEMLSA